MIQFNNVTKKYDNKISAVTEVSFKVDPGEFVFLIGPSGSGKTTVIKMLIRDEHPTSGQIYFNDTDITSFNRNKVYKLRREIGVIFQDFKLIPDKTAYENVAFAMEAAGKHNNDIKKTVPYVLDIVGLSDRMNAFPRQLSGGEQQRVAIARAISNNPKLLIADEPTGNLDPASAWDIVQILSKINNWGTTIIMSTHGTDIVNSLNKRVIQMDKGKVIRDDNKGQYEMTNNFEERMVEETENTEKKPARKKTRFATKINSPKEEQKNLNEQPKEEVKEKKPGFFGRLFGRKKKDNSDDNIEPAENKLIVEEPGLFVNLDTPPAPDIQSTTVEEPVNEDVVNSEEKAEELINSEEKTEISKLNLPRKIKKNLKKAGYNYVEEIISSGPEALSENILFSPDEIIKISKEIKEFVENKK